MRVTAREKNSLTVRLTRDELAILNNALNEVCHGIDIPEFSTRIGAEIDEAKALLKQLGDALETTEEGQGS